jgi:hypothetical protein
MNLIPESRGTHQIKLEIDQRELCSQSLAGISAISQVEELSQGLSRSEMDNLVFFLSSAMSKAMELRVAKSIKEFRSTLETEEEMKEIRKRERRERQNPGLTELDELLREL